MSLSFPSRGICNRAPIFSPPNQLASLVHPGYALRSQKSFPATPLPQHSSPNPVALETTVRPLNDVVREGFFDMQGVAGPSDLGSSG